MSSVVAAAVAHADNLDWHATAGGSVATTDNKNGAATNGGRNAGAFSDVRPGMLVTYNSPRQIHEANGEVDMLYQLGADKPNVTFRAGWKAYFLVGPRSEASASADASRGQINALNATRASDDNPLEVVPLGQVDMTSLDGGLQHSYTATKFSRVFDRAFARRATTDDSSSDVKTESQEIGFGLGLSYRTKRHNFLLEAGGSYVYLDKQDPFMRQMGSRRDHQLNPRAVATWQYDINKRWSTNLDGGVVYVHPVTELWGRDWRDPYMPNRTYKDGVFPLFGGVLAYTDVWGRAILQARRAVTPNLLIAQNTISDSLSLTFALPLRFLDKDSSRRDPRVVGIGSAGVSRSQLIDPETSDSNGQFIVTRADFTVAWQPRKGQTLGLRYEFSYQNGDTVGDRIIPSFFRNTFYFTFALRYPEEIQVRVPRRGQSVRADEGDLAPIGSEPVVVDPADLLEGDQQ